MSMELYEKFTEINSIDQAIYEAEKEVKKGAKPIALEEAIDSIIKKHNG